MSNILDFSNCFLPSVKKTEYRNKLYYIRIHCLICFKYLAQACENNAFNKQSGFFQRDAWFAIILIYKSCHNQSINKMLPAFSGHFRFCSNNLVSVLTLCNINM